MVRLNGSCHCGAVTFSARSHTPVPYMHCYCSICRKTAGGTGAAINIMAQAETLEVQGRDNLSVYRAKLTDSDEETLSPAQRHFCSNCGAALFIVDPRWPEWIYPHASAIDSPLPPPAERAHIMLDSAVDWAMVPAPGLSDRHFPGYPDQSIEDWHKSRGVHEA